MDAPKYFTDIKMTKPWSGHVDTPLPEGGDPVIDAIRRTIDTRCAAASDVSSGIFARELIDACLVHLPDDDVYLVYSPADGTGNAIPSVVYTPAFRRHSAFTAEYMREVRTRIHEQSIPVEYGDDGSVTINIPEKPILGS